MVQTILFFSSFLSLVAFCHHHHRQVSSLTATENLNIGMMYLAVSV